MSVIIQQPAANTEAKENFKNTIENQVSIDSFSGFLSRKQQQELREIYPSGNCMIWGATTANNGLSKWTRIGRGDVALFSGQNRIYSSAVVTYKLQNPELAFSLWGKDKEGQAWELIYFLDELKSQNISYLDFNRAAGYRDNNFIQGFTVMSPEKSEGIFRQFDLESGNYLPDTTPADYNKALDKLKELEETEDYIISTRRLEQGYHKQNLFSKRPLGKCGICNNEYPVSLLVAAHIQKRHLSSHKERTDPNIVMPMCTLGCDGLYEKGYISVNDGKVIRLKKSLSTSSLDAYINTVVGNNCSYYNEKTRAFFDWHNQFHNVIDK